MAQLHWRGPKRRPSDLSELELDIREPSQQIRHDQRVWL
jgi:hypothetical protein